MYTQTSPEVRLQLPDVTLCCVDTRAPAQAIYALHRSIEHVDFGDVLLLGLDSFATHPSLSDARIRLTPIKALTSIDDYSRFMLHELHQHIRTSHVLVIQWDGFIACHERWQDDFLRHDYIGAPWYHGGHPGLVGNGGFSLRSQRLLQATRDLASPDGEPEDMTICVHRRGELEQRHGIRIAPLALAQAFACEYGPYQEGFGFHGMHNFAHVMTSQELRDWLDQAPNAILQGQHARKLVKSLIATGRRADAMHLIGLRRRLLGATRDHYVLSMRAMASALRRSASPQSTP